MIKNKLTSRTWPVTQGPRGIGHTHTLVYIYIYIYMHIYDEYVLDEICIFWSYLFILSLYTCMFPALCFRQRTCMAQGLGNGVFKETWTHSCLQFEWFWVGYIFLCRSLLSFSYNVFLLVYFSLIHFWSVGVVSDFTYSYFSLCIFERVSLDFFCVRIYIYIYIYIYACFHLWLCTIDVLFNFDLNLSITFFSFIWSCALSFVWYIDIILSLTRLHLYRCFDTFNFLFSSILI